MAFDLSQLLSGLNNPGFKGFAGNALSDLGYGMTRGKNLNEGFQYATQRTAELDPMRMAELEQRQKNEQEQQALSRTADYLETMPGGKQYADAIRKGGMNGSDVFRLYLEDFRPKPPGDPVKGIEINGRLVNPVTGQEMGNFNDPSADKTNPYMSAGDGKFFNWQTGEYTTDPNAPVDPKAEMAAGRRATATDIVTSAAAKARALATEGNTGLGGAAWGLNPASDAAELRRQVAVLKATATLENLNAMRQSSPTGGALGAVSDSENAMLAAASGAIDPNAEQSDFTAALDNYERTLLRIIHGPQAGDQIFAQTRQQQGGGGGGSAADPLGIRQGSAADPLGIRQQGGSF